jgi:MOSC domain-containing protein YiiM
MPFILLKGGEHYGRWESYSESINEDSIWRESNNIKYERRSSLYKGNVFQIGEVVLQVSQVFNSNIGFFSFFGFVNL